MMNNPPLFNPPESLDLEAEGTWPFARHLFDSAGNWAIHAALASGRPLLLRGEPGIGKSQLARATAVHLQVPFLSYVVNERSERDDLFYRFDDVRRLAQAQLVAAQFRETQPDDTTGDEAWEKAMAEERFLRPGVLWWAFNWTSAKQQLAKACPGAAPPARVPDRDERLEDRPCGAVVLIDEIDKADPSVPNGLLECLANDGFDAQHLDVPVCFQRGEDPAPLVILTTNEERELPPAFLPRCLVLNFTFPPEGQSLEDFLVGRAKVQFEAEIDDDLETLMREQIVPELLRRRGEAEGMGVPIPGAAEFLDIVRVLLTIEPEERAAAFEQTKAYALIKNRADELTR